MFSLNDILNINFSRLLQSIKYSQVIKDPFPEDTEKEGKVFWGVFEFSQSVNIWQAYRMGYNKAYEEIKKDIKNKIREELQHELDMRQWKEKMKEYMEAK
jgi:hypothetical protein